MSESIRKLVSGRSFASAQQAEEAVDAILRDLPDADEVVSKEEAATRVENAELKSHITLLESKVDELKDKVAKVHKLNERIDEQRVEEVAKAKQLAEAAETRLSDALSEVAQAKAEAAEEAGSIRRELEEARMQIYKLDKVAGLPNGRELLGLMESVQDRAVVDRLVAKRGVSEIGDPNLRAVREHVMAQRKGMMSDMHRLEESTANVKVQNELGHNMAEMAILAGIPTKG